MIIRLIGYARARFAAHRRYRKTIAEIETLSNGELIELGAFRSDLLAAARFGYLSKQHD